MVAVGQQKDRILSQTCQLHFQNTVWHPLHDLGRILLLHGQLWSRAISVQLDHI